MPQIYVMLQCHYSVQCYIYWLFLFHMAERGHVPRRSYFIHNKKNLASPSSVASQSPLGWGHFWQDGQCWYLLILSAQLPHHYLVCGWALPTQSTGPQTQILWNDTVQMVLVDPCGNFWQDGECSSHLIGSAAPSLSCCGWAAIWGQEKASVGEKERPRANDKWMAAR